MADSAGWDGEGAGIDIDGVMSIEARSEAPVRVAVILCRTTLKLLLLCDALRLANARNADHDLVGQETTSPCAWVKLSSLPISGPATAECI